MPDSQTSSNPSLQVTGRTCKANHYARLMLEKRRPEVVTASKEYTDANNTLQAMKRYPRPEWSERSAQIVKMDKKHKALQDVETAIAKEPNSAASHQDLHGERDEAEDGDTLWNNHGPTCDWPMEDVPKDIMTETATLEYQTRHWKDALDLIDDDGTPSNQSQQPVSMAPSTQGTL